MTNIQAESTTRFNWSNNTSHQCHLFISDSEDNPTRCCRCRDALKYQRRPNSEVRQWQCRGSIKAVGMIFAALRIDLPSGINSRRPAPCCTSLIAIVLLLFLLFPLHALVSSGTLSRDAFSGAGGAPYSTHRGSPSAPQLPQAALCRPSACQPGAEGRKRRSPNAMKEKPSKLSRPDARGILTSGPESPRQVSATCQSNAEVFCSHSCVCCTVRSLKLSLNHVCNYCLL